MPRRRLLRATAAIGALLAVGGVLAAPPAAAADEVRAIAFPVGGKVQYTDTFGAPRSGGRTHEGTDLMGTKMQPLLAAVEGTVVRVKFENTSTGGNSVIVQDAEGWTYHYLHVNNDTPGTDDGSATRAQAFPSDIVVGATVTRGQVVAYLGDSGNAESAGAHLHFEIRKPPAEGAWVGSGIAINPYPSLLASSTWVEPGWWALRSSPASRHADLVFELGTLAGDRAVLCDWDGDGVDEPVLVRGSRWFLRSELPGSGIDARMTFGTGAEAALCANVDEDPADEPILFSAGTWTVRGGWTAEDTVLWTATFGVAEGDQPVIGDWDGDGLDDFGIKRGSWWYLRSSGGATGTSARAFSYGTLAGDAPVAGDWDGDGDVDAGIYRAGRFHLRSGIEPTGRTIQQVSSGAAGDQPLTGHWTAGTRSGLGHYRPVAPPPPPEA